MQLQAFIIVIAVLVFALIVLIGLLSWERSQRRYYERAYNDARKSYMKAIDSGAELKAKLKEAESQDMDNADWWKKSRSRWN